MQRQNERDWFGGVSGEKYMGFMVGHRLNLIPIKFIGAARNWWYKPVFLSTTRFLSFGCRNTCFTLCSPDHCRASEFSPRHHTHEIHYGQKKGAGL